MLEQAKPGPIKVLIVEDDPVTRKSLCLAVESAQELQLLDALDNVGAAIAWLNERAPDVLLVDLGLPDGSGLDVIRACAAKWPAADIMVVTMASDEASVVSCVEAGASGYVLKNAVGPDIVKAILDLRQGGAPMSPAIARMVLTRIRASEAADSAPAPQAEAAATRLTKREAVILDLIAKGQSYSEVARLLAVSVGTVQTHIKNIYGKLSVHSRGEAVFEAHRRGLLQFEQTRARK